MTDEINVLALYFVGGRMANEPSHAAESWKYSRDPAENVRFESEKQGEEMRRVKKEEVKREVFSNPDGLDTCLELWKSWMEGDADKDLRAKPMGGLVGNTDGYDVDSSEAQQASDTRIAVATDAMIDSMKRIHIWAIYKSCSIATAWNYPNADMVSTLMDARDILTEKLKRNVCTGVMF